MLAGKGGRMKERQAHNWSNEVGNGRKGDIVEGCWEESKFRFCRGAECIPNHTRLLKFSSCYWYRTRTHPHQKPTLKLPSPVATDDCCALVH
jgi:hypothetical protein